MIITEELEGCLPKLMLNPTSNQFRELVSETPSIPDVGLLTALVIRYAADFFCFNNAYRHQREHEED
jgi:hypothetical protein